MGYHCGVDFNSGTPVPIATNISSFEGCASVCDSLGHLLFYTDGNTIWRGATGAVMPFGAIINGGGNNTSSTTQGALIVPDPGNRNRYYVFSQSAHPISNLFCNVVDMSLFGGAGALDTSFALRGVMLEDSLSEKMFAVKGCQNNIWVVVHSRIDTTFLAYLVTPFGINTSPVVSSTGGGGSLPEQYAFKVMKISPDRSKIVVSGATRLELFDFDYLSGIVYNPKTLSATMGGYGGAFSPDGTKYYSAGKQYDLSAADPSTAVTNLNVQIVSDMRLAPDGKIYFKSPVENFGTFLGRINNPNAAGFACNIQDSVTALTFPLTGLTYGLPQEVVIADPVFQIATGLTDTLICDMPPGGLTLHTAGNYIVWDDGSSGLTRTVTEPGTYHVFAMGSACKSHYDSFIIKGLLKPVEITRTGDELGTTHTYDSYQWYKDGAVIPAATNPTLYISRNGWYSVVVHDQWGCSDSTAFQVTGFTGIDDPGLLKASIKVYPNPARNILQVDAPFPVRLSLFNIEGRLLLRSEDKSLDVRTLARGLYLLQIADKDNWKISVEKINKL